jgi:chromosome segregation ATPase
LQAKVYSLKEKMEEAGDEVSRLCREIQWLEATLDSERQHHVDRATQLQDRIAVQEEEIHDLNKKLQYEQRQHDQSQTESRERIASQAKEIKSVHLTLDRLRKEHVVEAASMKRELEAFQRVAKEGQARIIERLRDESKALREAAGKAQIAVTEAKRKAVESQANKVKFKREMLERVQQLKQAWKRDSEKVAAEWEAQRGMLGVTMTEKDEGLKLLEAEQVSLQDKLQDIKVEDSGIFDVSTIESEAEVPEIGRAHV